MRLIFMGTAPFACPTLRTLLASGHEVIAAVTQPDRPRGRGRKLAASAVKTLALEQHLRVLQPASLRSAAVVDTLATLQPDVIVVVAYGNILPASVLQLPPYGCINLHASLLPKYRGPAPINWTLIHGEVQTGFTIIHMDAHVDTGPILSSKPCEVRPEDDALSLGARLAESGAAGMVEVLTALEGGALSPRAQPTEGVSLAPKLTRKVGRLDWQQAAATLHNLIRGVVPWPGATARFRQMEVKMWRAAVRETDHTLSPGTVIAATHEGLCLACGVQQLIVYELQPANRRRMSAWEFTQGYRVQQGDHFA
ncbi:Methionyl-tRNA formyltransferase [Candidatus Entotheonellaceae bacterium PAL068K]